MKSIDVPRFEVVTARSGNVLVSFVGGARVAEGASAKIEGSDLVVDRGGHPPLRFVGLTPQDAVALRKAPMVFLNRTFRNGVDDTCMVNIC